jgi:putative restriction endonuclease
MSASSPSWETLLASMRVFTRGSERAVHKPLLALMILARAQRGGPANVFRFRDLDPPLRDALQAFGPPRRAHRSEQPFWRLKEDGFWRIHDEERLSQGKPGVPSRRALLEADAAAEVPMALWDELRADPARVARLIQAVMKANWPVERHGELLSTLVFDLSLPDDDLV